MEISQKDAILIQRFAYRSFPSLFLKVDPDLTVSTANVCIKHDHIIDTPQTPASDRQTLQESPFSLSAYCRAAALAFFAFLLLMIKKFHIGQGVLLVRRAQMIPNLRNAYRHRRHCFFLPSGFYADDTTFGRNIQEWRGTFPAHLFASAPCKRCNIKGNVVTSREISLTSRPDGSIIPPVGIFWRVIAFLQELCPAADQRNGK